MPLANESEKTTTDQFQTELYTSILVSATKRMNNAPIFWCKFLHQYLEYKKVANYTQNPLKMQWAIYLTPPNVYREKCTTILSVFRGLVPTPKTYLSFFGSLIFFFILVHTQVIQVGNQYIIIYTMEKYHFNCTSVFNCLICLLSFLKV